MDIKWKRMIDEKPPLGYYYRRIMLLSMIIIVTVIFCVLFNEPHMGAANNGDFYRLAERVGVNGVESFTDDETPYWNKLYEQWKWNQMNWENLTPKAASFSNIWPVSFVRLIINIISNTESVPFNTRYLAILYAILLIIAYWFLTKFVIAHAKLFSPYIIFLAIIMFLGSAHLAWFNSFYGEAMTFVSLISSVAFMLTAIDAEKGSMRGKIIIVLLFIASYCFLMAKPQNVLAYPFWVFFISLITVYTGFFKSSSSGWGGRTITRTITILIYIFFVLWTGVSCLRLYQWNTERNEKETIISATLDGILTLTENPEDLLEALNMDPILAQDVGKNAYSDPNDMYAPPYSDKAQEMIYDKIDTMELLKFYISHPDYLYKALEITAQYATELPTSLHRFSGEEQKPGIGENGRLTLWENIRKYLVPHHFWQYIVVYIFLFAFCIKKLMKEKENRMYISLYMLIMITGIMQYPLPFIGNGYADTNKQLYLFMLCYDITFFTAVSYIFYKVWNSWFKRSDLCDIIY